MSSEIQHENEESLPPIITNDQSKKADDEINFFLNQMINMRSIEKKELDDIEEKEEDEKKPTPPRSESPIPFKRKPKELCTSRVHRFRDWCEIAGVPSEDIENYAEKLKKHFNEHDEDSEQEEHESYQEEMDEWKDDMMERALSTFQEMDEKYEEELDEKYRRRRGFPPVQTNSKEYFYTKNNPQWNENEEDGIIYD